MTISSIAGNLCKTYELTSKASYTSSTVNDADYSKDYYNVTDIQKALEDFNAKNPTDNIFTDSSAQVSDKVDLNGITGDLLSYSKNTYIASKLGLVIGPVNLYSVHSPTEFAKTAYSTYLFNTKLSKVLALNASKPQGSTLNTKA